MTAMDMLPLNKEQAELVDLEALMLAALRTLILVISLVPSSVVEEEELLHAVTMDHNKAKIVLYS